MSLTEKLLGLPDCYFIQEIKSILSTKPKEEWCTGIRTNEKGQHCAFGWIDEIEKPNGVRVFQSPLSQRVCDTIGGRGFPLAEANNGKIYQHIDNPKDRSLAFLEDWLKTNCQ